ncbi:FAD-dependent oxidoreductase [Microbacterium marinilacus]|uniref:FAD-dependent oxidoreductase n=1 Tax=Microbacterium marinilacus TaxID=415209 RepID=A0ABP7BQJ7_9MICO|nr:FAD-dependent oxidoreductase [Microbacterium marinilacus]MBY0689800.1 FAD-dependent oxidoreductase [Microbacterium marinilacus]
MHDLAVIGLGALGVHVAAEAARRGLDVVAIDSGNGDHEHAATGGRTRIFRLAYTFGGDYVPALRRSMAAWDALAETAPGTRHDTGALLIGAPDDPEIRKALEAVADHGIAHELIEDAGLLAERWPQHRLLPGDLALYDPAGALLVPPAVTAAVAEQARAAGASLHYGTEAARVEPSSNGSEVVTAAGRRVRARTVVVAAGAWSGRFVPAFDRAVELRRALLHWYDADEEAYGPARFPVGLRRSGAARYSFFPRVDQAGIKVNFHQPKPRVTDAGARDAAVPPDIDVLEARLHDTIAGLGARRRTAAYVESYTPDYRVLLGRVAGIRDTWLLAGGSGQAFKLAPALAEHVVDRLLDVEPALTLRGVVRGLEEAPAAAVVGP